MNINQTYLTKMSGIFRMSLILFLSLTFCTFVFAAPNPSSSPVRKASPGKVKSHKSKKPKNMNVLLAHPDFAMPRDVASNASKSLENALKEDKPVDALQAAIQLTIAEESVTADSTKSAYGRLLDLSNRLKAPYSNVARLLTAEFLTQIYNSNPYNYDARQLPENSLDADPQNWSGQQFKKRISELEKEALDDTQLLSDTPLTTIDKILTCNTDYKGYGFSLLDFITSQVMDINRSIGKSEDNAALLEALIADDTRRAKTSAEVRDGALLCARVQQLRFVSIVAEEPEDDSDSENETKIYRLSESLLNDYADSKVYYKTIAAVYIYSYGAFSMENRQAFLKRAEAAAADVKSTQTQAEKNAALAVLNYVKGNIIASDVNLTADSQVLPHRSFEVNWDNTSCRDFTILVVQLPENVLYQRNVYEDNFGLRQIKSLGKVVASRNVRGLDILPFEERGTVAFEGLPSGVYALLFSTDGTLAGAKGDNHDFTLMTVSNLTFFTTAVGEENRIYIVNAHNNAPLPGVSVTLKQKEYRWQRNHNTAKSVDLVTGSDGSVLLPEDFSNGYTLLARHQGNILYADSNRKTASSESLKPFMSGRIFTDLAIYKPGDNVGCVVSLYNFNDNNFTAAEGIKTQVRLLNYAGETVAERTVTTDVTGRAEASFTLPTDGMTGRWSLVADAQASNAEGQPSNYRDTARFSTGFEVAEYKSPTFRVVLQKPDISESASDISFKGNVSTYSGMPLADSKVTVNVRFEPWWRWGRRLSEKTFNLNAVTDREGNFTVDVTPDLLRGIDSGFGLFVSSATAVSQTGESQISEPVRFALGQHYTLGVNVPSAIEVREKQDTVVFSAKVSDALGNPAVKRVDYTIESLFGSKVSLNGVFDSPQLNVPSSSLPSGKYKLTFRLADEADADTVTAETVIWRDGDRIAPSPEAVWVPVKKIYAKRGEKSVRIPFGSAFADSRIFAIISKSATASGASSAESRWISVNARMESLEVEAPSAGQSLQITFYGIHDLDREKAVVQVLPAADNVKYEIVTETFRDKITPGSNEQWRFRLTADGAGVNVPAAIAVLSNAALNAITPFEWHIDNSIYSRYRFTGNLTYPNAGHGSVYCSWLPSPNYVDPGFPEVPEWNFYGRELYGMYGFGQKFYTMKVRGAMPTGMNSGMVMNEMMADSCEAVEEEAADFASVKESSSEAGAAADAKGEDSEPLRDIECPLAFFKPMLVGNGSGEISVNFEAPNFNTTWQFQMIAYDPANMKQAYALLNTVASKPVMVQTGVPRFLRTSDQAQVSATVFNNTDDALDVTCEIEIFDTETGTVYSHAYRTFPTMAPSASEVVFIEFEVPQFISSLGVRSIVRSDRGRDGEQTLVPVLPAVQPMIDSETFYLQTNEAQAEFRIPKMRSDSRVTLEYCDNPEWYALMGLNDLLEPDSESVLSIADAYYSNIVGMGVLDRNSRLREQLEKVTASGDTLAMTSNLQKNQQLKITTLKDTPWVNNALAETMRMRGISALCDSARVESAVAKLLTKLQGLQNGDGGWSWIKGFPSSSWMSQEVLWRFSALKALDMLPADTYGMINEGIAYTDKELENDYREAQKYGGYRPGFSDVEYFFIRGRFNRAESQIVARIKKMTIDMIVREWRNFDVAEKCYGAMLLNANGKRKTALEIMESLRQFASYKPSKGMWFDGATSALSRTAPVDAAALAMTAFREILPGDESIERLRQYLLLSRQTQDWQLGLSAGRAVRVAQSVLLTPVDSDRPADAAFTLLLNGKPLDLNGKTDMPGSFTLDLDPKTVSGKTLRIERQPGVPGWGGVMSQYVAPLKDVKAKSMEQLKIERAYYPVLSDSLVNGVGDATSGFRRGDRIKVTLTVTADRDLDYLVVSDSRGACMEPCDQLTEHVTQDGLVYVRETNNSATNLYFYRMPKGTFIVSYEVTADRDGIYSCGSATTQCLYYPLITARTAAQKITVK